jgi:hypothetical protein
LAVWRKNPIVTEGEATPAAVAGQDLRNLLMRVIAGGIGSLRLRSLMRADGFGPRWSRWRRSASMSNG